MTIGLAETAPEPDGDTSRDLVSIGEMLKNAVELADGAGETGLCVDDGVTLGVRVAGVVGESEGLTDDTMDNVAEAVSEDVKKLPV